MTTVDLTTERPGTRVAVSSTGESTDSAIDPRFGRCPYFVISDELGGCLAVRNRGQSLGNGAGIQAAQQMLDLGVAAVLTGDVGPNAYRVLSSANVRIFVKCDGTVRSVLEDYRNGSLRETSSPTSPGRHGHGPRWG